MSIKSLQYATDYMYSATKIHVISEWISPDSVPTLVGINKYPDPIPIPHPVVKYDSRILNVNSYFVDSEQSLLPRFVDATQLIVHRTSRLHATYSTEVSTNGWSCFNIPHPGHSLLDHASLAASCMIALTVPVLMLWHCQAQKLILASLGITWNALPSQLRSSSISHGQFRAGVKTHLFT